jgi:hypothetical protein
MSKPKPKKSNRIVYKPIAANRPVVSVENLPLSIVHYPGHYGSFLAFQATSDSNVFFCGCFRNALENYFLMCLPNFIENQRIGLIEFPSAVLDALEKKHVGNFNDFKNNFQFQNKLCHECNGRLPQYRYCHEYYGSSFKQNYGWYINKQAYDYGITPHYTVKTGIRMPDICPQEILDLIDISDVEIHKIFEEYNQLKLINEIEARALLDEKLSPAKKQRQNIMKIIENIVREKFGHKKIGEAWINETDLFHIISSIYPDHKILRHFRPQFLTGLELDIYLPEISLGIEYQGIQHYESIEHWGGEEALVRLQTRDKIKVSLCAENNVTLVYFYHYEILSDELIKSKLDNLII